MLAKSNYYVNDRLVDVLIPQKWKTNLKKRALQLPLIFTPHPLGFHGCSLQRFTHKIPIHFNAKCPMVSPLESIVGAYPSLQAFFILD